MNRIFVFVFAFVSFLETFAQAPFVERVTAVVSGQGRVTVHQDARLDSILNGYILIPSTPEAHHETPRPVREVKTTQSKVNDYANRASQHRGTNKVRGFRVQVFFGGNSRADQTKAQQLGARIQSRYPELHAYTSFENPHWRCRVGDFTNREDAAHYVSRLRASGLAPDAMVVKSEVYED